MARKTGALRPSALLILLVAAFPAWAQQPAKSVANEYVIGPQDVLTITVFDQENLNGKYQVDADGTFTFPLIGRIRAGGLTVRDFESELRKRLMDGYFRNPQISVGVEHYRSQRIFIVGEVRNAGTYPLTGDMSLIEAIARAGSTLPSASGEALIVRGRGAAEGPTMPTGDQTDVTTVDLKALQSGALDQNLTLHDGDTIFVPRAETIYVFGQVKSPGAYPLITKDTTVLQALSLAGGITDRGATGRIRIVRLEKGKKTEVRVRLTDIVRAGDTVIVPERFF